MKKFFWINMVLVFLSLYSNAQGIRVYASWSTAVPIGELTDFVRTTSGRGFQLDVEQNINERFTYGGNFSWQAFYEKDFQMYFDDYSLITGWQRNYVNAMILMGTSKYYFSTSANNLKAYISLEVGVTAIENYEIFGLNEHREMEWHFAVAPALGVLIPANTHNSFGFNLYIKFPNSFANNSSIHYSWINSGVGIYVKIPD